MISSASELTQASALAPASKVTGTQNIGQDGYLKLLTAQMESQDPFAPVDNNQMVAQMAQIQQSSGIAEINQTLKAMADIMGGSRLSDAASWIGKSMLVQSSFAAPDRFGQYAGELTLTSPSDAVSVDLVDDAGAVVRTIDLGAQKAGTVPFYWDGKDDAGNQIGNQPLEVRVRGGSTARIATWASVAAVQSPASGAGSTLITSLGQYQPSDALKVA